MVEQQPVVPAPLNRGGNAALGVVLLLAIFTLAGPLIGGVAVVGPLGFFAYEVSYALGIVPAIVAGTLYSTLWIFGVEARQRALIVVVVGTCTSAAVSLAASGQEFLLYMAWAGCIASLACSMLANVVIRSTERRSQQTDP